MLLELRGRRAVDRPVAGVVRTHRELVDQQPAVRGLEQLDGQQPDDVELLGDPQRHAPAPRRPAAGSRSGAGAITSAQMPSFCTVSHDRLGARLRRWPSGPRWRRARGRSRPAPRPSSATPASEPRRSARPLLGVDDPDALAVVAAARRLEHDRPAVPSAERGHVGRVGRPASSAGTARRGRPAARASRTCPGRTAAPRARAHGDAVRHEGSRCSSGTCSWSKVTTSQPAAKRRRSPGPVVADHDVGATSAAESSARVGEHPQPHAERDRRLLRHAGQLSAADHAHHWKPVIGSVTGLPSVDVDARPPS